MVYLPGYSDFYTDAENSALFFKTRKGNFVKYDSRLQPVSSFENMGSNYAAACRNGSLFILGSKKLMQINTRNKLIVSPLYTNDTTDLKPQAFHYTMNGNLGNIGSKVYKQKRFNDAWEYAFELPFATDSGRLSMKDSTTIMFNRQDDSLFYYNISHATLEKKTKKGMIERFCASDIKTIIFSKGVQGCFNSASSEKIYELEDGRFVLSRNNDKGGTHYLIHNEDEIDADVVNEFVRKIPAIYNKQATIDDLEFTRKEYDACKRNIIAYKTYLERQGSARDAGEKGCAFYIIDNNLDFPTLIALVDSVKTIDPAILNKALSSYEMVSTTSFSAGIRLVNTNREELEIRTIYYEPDAFYFPWRITLNGSVSTSMAIEINKFLNQVFPQLLDYSSKVTTIQHLVRELYWSKE